MPLSTRRWRWDSLFDSAWSVAVLYALVTLVTTWPLAAHLTRSLPGDLGDPPLNCWILAWGADHLRAWLAGDPQAFANYWQAPFFHPSPLVLAYSEHLFAEVVQIAPVYWLTGNILLSYNLLFISTFVLSGVGMYLLVRELTGSAPAAWVAGLCYAFAPYRLAQIPHVQVLGSGWIPLVFFGLRRYFVRGRGGVPLGATAALTVQNLSCGYFLIFLPPFVALYCLFEIADRRLWRSLSVWAGLLTSALVTAIVCWPFLHPYLMLRQLSFAARTIAEVKLYSADLLSFVTASPSSRVWGWLRVFPKAEGELFPGLVLPVLVLIGMGAHASGLWRRLPDRSGDPAFRRHAAALLLATAAVTAGFALFVGVTNDPAWRPLGVRIRLHEQWHGWALVALCLVGAAVLSSRVRAAWRGVPGSVVGFYAVMAVLSAWMALGPAIALAGRPTRLVSLYAFAYEYVPGFDGLRVAARYGMLMAFALAVLAGFGARVLQSRRRGRLVLAGVAVALLLETTPFPLPLDRRHSAAGYRAAPDHVYTGSEIPEAYQAAARLPPGSTLIEFPFGSVGWDVQYVFYQQAHGHPIVNGYSGGFPAWYNTAIAVFQRLAGDPDAAWAELRYTGASHALVHLDAYRRGDAEVVEAWLTTHGAILHSSGHSYRLYRLPPP